MQPINKKQNYRHNAVPREARPKIHNNNKGKGKAAQQKKNINQVKKSNDKPKYNNNQQQGGGNNKKGAGIEICDVPCLFSNLFGLYYVLVVLQSPKFVKIHIKFS